MQICGARVTVQPRVAIVDYGLGNLFSIRQACARAGLDTVLVSEASGVAAAHALILPGVGAFGDAMATLRRLDLVAAIQDFAASGRPLMGICLGVQLLMSRSFEFGEHQGLNIIRGDVRHLGTPVLGARPLKVPQIGWNGIVPAPSPGREEWSGTMLEGIARNEHMYFIHSYVVVPDDSAVVLSTSRYGDQVFCSSVQSGRIFACQFHPERSGPAGLAVYQNLRRQMCAGEK